MAHSLAELAANSKNIITGIMVILSLIGAAYGTFKPETDARITYDTLAPEVDLLNSRTEKNIQDYHALEARVIKLESENAILQDLLVAYLAREGIESPKNKVKIGIVPTTIDKLKAVPPAPIEPKQETAIPIQVRKRPEPYWKK